MNRVQLLKALNLTYQSELPVIYHIHHLIFDHFLFLLLQIVRLSFHNVVLETDGPLTEYEYSNPHHPAHQI